MKMDNVEILRIITELAKKSAPSGMEDARAKIFKKLILKLKRTK